MKNLWKRDPMDKTSSERRQMVWQKAVGAIPETMAFRCGVCMFSLCVCNGAGAAASSLDSP